MRGMRISSAWSIVTPAARPAAPVARLTVMAGSVSEEEFLGCAGWGQDLDSPGVEAVTDVLLEEPLDAEAEQAALLVQPDEAAVDGLGAEGAGLLGPAGSQAILLPERLGSDADVLARALTPFFRASAKDWLWMVSVCGLRTKCRATACLSVVTCAGLSSAVPLSAAVMAWRSRVSTVCHRSSVAWLSTGTKFST